RGDSSDNIPGVPGVGEKTAIQLLQDYKTLDGVYKNLDKLKESLRKKLEDGKKSAYLSKELATIWTDAPVKLDLKAMDVSKLDTARLKQMLQDLEFRSLMANLPEHMRAEAPAEDTIADTKLKLPKNVLIDSDAKLKELKLPASKQVFIH